MRNRKRIWVPHLFHHVSNRGNRKEPIFRNVSDYLFFLDLLQRAHKLYSIEICAYCLMGNHYHLQLRSKHASLSAVMAFINKKYADHFNKKYNLTGHLFERKFFSKPAYDHRSNLNLSRYIHQNPVKADIVRHPEDYRWSSYSFFLTGEETPLPPYMNISPLLYHFPGTSLEQKQSFIEWARF
ncbi:transposase [Evansella clarkii]|uniref:transposase n=1 Tax=Evansella clarkii TaxID=79879 RepID=UPI000B43EA17|nr:transposase [Evansella clarkii]